MGDEGLQPGFSSNPSKEDHEIFWIEQSCDAVKDRTVLRTVSKPSQAPTPAPDADPPDFTRTSSCDRCIISASQPYATSFGVRSLIIHPYPFLGERRHRQMLSLPESTAHLPGEWKRT